MHSHRHAGVLQFGQAQVEVNKYSKVNTASKAIYTCSSIGDSQHAGVTPGRVTKIIYSKLKSMYLYVSIYVKCKLKERI